MPSMSPLVPPPLPGYSTSYSLPVRKRLLQGSGREGHFGLKHVTLRAPGVGSVPLLQDHNCIPIVAV